MALKRVGSSNALIIGLAPSSGSGGTNLYINYGRDWENVSADFDGYDLTGSSDDQRTHAALDPRLVDPDIELGSGTNDGQSLIGGELQVVVDSDDVLKGRGGGEDIFVAQGDDSVDGGGGGDLIVGGDGDDTLIGGSGNDKIYGDYSNIPDYIRVFDSRRKPFWKFELPEDEDTSVTGDDLLRGGDGADQLFGGPGNDQLEGGPRGDGNADLLVGGPGADIFYLNYDDGDDPNASNFWYGYADLATGAFAEDSVKDTVKNLAEDAASGFFSSIEGGFILGGTVDVLTTSIKSGIDALFKLTEAAKAPKDEDDVMVVADFDPREDVLVLPLESGKELTATANTDMTAPVGGLTGVGVEFSTVDGVFAQVFLDEDFLAEFDLDFQSTAAEDFILNMFQTSLIIESSENSKDPDQGGIQNGIYPFPTDDDSYVDGQAPDGIEDRIAATTPPGTRTAIYGAFAPWSLVLPAQSTTTAFVAGTNMGDILNVNRGGFAPDEAVTSGMLTNSSTFVKGFGGADIIFGGNGLDEIYGGEGDDDIYGIGQSGVEVQEKFFGEEDDDRIFLGWTSTWALADGGEGNDWIDFLYLEYALTFDLTKTEMSGSSLNSNNNVTSRYDAINIENVAGTRLDDTITGDDGDNILQGNDGNDIIETGGGTDTAAFADNSGRVVVDLTLTSADGTLITDEYGEDGTANADTVVSNDTITGGIANLIGSDFDDSLTGDDAANAIDGGPGEDTVLGGAGNDSLQGGAGADEIEGGSGDDTLQGDSGEDTLKGGADNDLVEGQSGNDWLEGGDGEDTLQGGQDDDTLKGGADNDLLQGFPGNDWLEGGNGDDFLQGGQDDDTLRGDKGDDTVNGSTGDDAIFWSSGLGNDVINGGEDTDTLTVQTSAAFLKSPSIPPISLEEAGGTLNIRVPIVANTDVGDEILGVTNVETIVIEPAPDVQTSTFFGVMPDVTVSGLPDFVKSIVWTGDDTENLFDGGSATTQSLVLHGAGGDDTIIGGAGADLLDGGAGEDFISGGNGNDSFTWAFGDGNDQISGDDGTDDLTIDADDGVAGSGTTVLASVELVQNILEPTEIAEGVQFKVAGQQFTMLDVENFTIDADPDGTTTKVSGNLSDAGVAQNTVIFNGADGADVFDGSEMTGPVRVVLNGGDGNDTLIGGSGNDLIDGGLGTNVMHGGDGLDTFIGDVEHLVGDLIGDFEAGETIILRDHAFDVDLASIDIGAAAIGIDTNGDGVLNALLNVEGDFSALERERFQVEQVGNDVHITLLKQVADTPIRDGGDGTPGDDFLFGSDDPDFLAGRAGNDVLDGNGGGDFLFGGPDSDVIRGGGDADRIFGSSGDDFAFGGRGNDFIFGGPGNDHLNGGLGNDDLVGGPGDDTYTGTAAELDGDWIIGFGTGDKIVIDRFEFDVEVETTWFGRSEIHFDTDGDGSLDGSMRVYGVSGRRSFDVDQVDGDTVITLGEPEPFGGFFSAFYERLADHGDFFLG